MSEKGRGNPAFFVMGDEERLCGVRPEISSPALY